MTAIRPRDLALFLLASGDLLPRQRARDQQADVAGLELKRRVLNLLVARDPEPEDLEAALAQIIEQIGPPYGPTRAICMIVRDECALAAGEPGFTDWLLDQALRESARTPEQDCMHEERRKRTREAPNNE